MQTSSELRAEVSKLNKSQRDAMRRVVSTPLSALTVTAIGWKTRVVATSIGFEYHVDLGPRGAVLDRKIYQP